MSNKTELYQSQDRGTQTEYEQYLSAMDAISIEKVASASVFYDPTPGNILVDVGMASGTSTNILAHLFPQLKVIGVDINPKMVDFANQTYSRPNLLFTVDDGETLSTFENNSISGFLNCSSIHHITSYNGYDPNRAFNTLQRQTELLMPGGIIVVRDFVKPPEMEVILELNQQGFGNKPSDAELLIAFSKTARSLANPNEQGFPLKELNANSNGNSRFLLQYTDAVEFIRRKDYFDNWEVELQEEYGYFSQKEFEEIFSELGLRIIVSNPIYNPWITRNRYKEKFSLYNKELQDIGFPPTNYLIAAEKVEKKRTYIHLVRHLPEMKVPFLNYSSYIDTNSQKIYDVVSRPSSVIDVIPYILNNNRIEILAKHGYPRPLASLITDSPIIDQKHFSGYITEGITASFDQTIETVIAERIGLKRTDVEEIHSSLEYFPSPGGIAEKVESFFVKLLVNPESKTIGKTIEGYAVSGSIRKFDAIQLLKTAQTGALVEARLELNIYNLLRKLQIPYPKWMGENIEINELQIETSSLKSILNETNSPFEPSAQSAEYLQKHRVKFSENGNNGGTSILEYVIPDKVSINTLISLPITRYKDEIYVGLEIRNLPVPQLLLGNSVIAVAPATRLPKTINTFKGIEEYLLQIDMFGTKIITFNRLGEKYFPSIGVTPEQAYPYVVTLAETNNNLKWVRLQELFKNLELIKDGHLLIAIARLINALDYQVEP